MPEDFLAGLNIVKTEKIKFQVTEEIERVDADWIMFPESWNKEEFFENTKIYLQKKNGVLDLPDIQLLMMMTSQISIYVAAVNELIASGLTIEFNSGATVGPNPHMTIADKALNRTIQIMKELEISPKARAGYRSDQKMSPKMKQFLKGP